MKSCKYMSAEELPMILNVPNSLQRTARFG